MVDVPKTLHKNRRNEAIDLFLSSILRKEKAVFESKICCLSNWLPLVQLGAYHLLIPALPLLPHILLPLLLAMEIGFLMVSVIPYFTIVHHIGWFHLTAKVLRFVFIEIFLGCCLFLCFDSKNRRRALNPKIQEMAILAIIMGLAAEYVVFFVNMVMVITKSIKKLLSKEKKEGYIVYKKEEEDRGLGGVRSSGKGRKRFKKSVLEFGRDDIADILQKEVKNPKTKQSTNWLDFDLDDEKKTKRSLVSPHRRT